MNQPTAMSNLGSETFRGTLGASMLRTTLYSKNGGERSLLSSGVERFASPVSGNIFVTPDAGRGTPYIDPITGTTFYPSGGSVAITQPVVKQQMRYSHKFNLTKDVDVFIQTLRNTTKFSRFTGERIGTAGTRTGEQDIKPWRAK